MLKTQDQVEICGDHPVDAPHSSRGHHSHRLCICLMVVQYDAQMLCKTNTVLSHKTNVMKYDTIIGGFLMITALVLVLK